MPAPSVLAARCVARPSSLRATLPRRSLRHHRSRRGSMARRTTFGPSGASVRPGMILVQRDYHAPRARRHSLSPEGESTNPTRSHGSTGHCFCCGLSLVIGETNQLGKRHEKRTSRHGSDSRCTWCARLGPGARWRQWRRLSRWLGHCRDQLGQHCGWHGLEWRRLDYLERQPNKRHEFGDVFQQDEPDDQYRQFS